MAAGRKSLLNAQLNLLPPTNVKKTVTAINKQLKGLVVTFDVKDLTAKLRAIKTSHLRQLKVTFDISDLKNKLRAIRSQKITITVDSVTLRRNLNSALRGFRANLRFNIAGLRAQVVAACRTPVRLRFDISHLYTVLARLNASGINLRVNVNATVRNVTRSLRQTSQAARTATDDMEHFGEQAGLAIRRYGAFTLATTGFFKLAGAISAGVSEAIKFDRELVRLSQVTGLTLGGLAPLADEVTRLSKEFGASSSEVLNVAVTLAQAGLSAKDTQIALEALTKTTVSASFGDIKDTTEAAIAIMQQFGKEASDLEGILGSVNAVSAKYAVEAEDITVAVRRAGGAFQAAGGSLDEFQALFTSVRQTTRESAETISVGLRTIFSRLQRVRTQNFLEALGIDVLNDENQFIGPYKAIQKIGEALKQVKSTDPRFAQIVEELGGFRQVSKVIPLLQQMGIQNEALNVSLRGGTSLAEDAEVAQKSLAVQFAKVREEFLALIRTFANNTAFRATINSVLEITKALIKLTSALADVAPALLALGGTKLASDFAPFFRGFNKKIPFLGQGVQSATPTTRAVVAARRAGNNTEFNPAVSGIAGVGALSLISAFTNYMGGAGSAISNFTTVVSAAAITIASIGSLSGSLASISGANKIGGVRDSLLRPFGVKSNVAAYRDANRAEQTAFFASGQMGPFNPDVGDRAGRNAARRNSLKRTALTLGLGAFGGIAAAGGEVLSGYASNDIQNGSRSTTKSGVAGALSYGGSGALLGSALGPFGIAIGAAVGGIYGFVAATKKAAQDIIAVNIGKSLGELTSNLEALTNNRASVSSIRSNVIGGINQIPAQLQGADATTRQNVIAQFNQDSTKLDVFFKAVAGSSATFKEFESKTDGTLKVFAGLSKIPYSALEGQIKDQIEAQRKSLIAQKQINKAQTEEVRNANEINALREAIRSVADESDKFGNSLKVLTDLRAGNIGAGLSGDLTNAINAAASGRVGDDKTLNRISGSSLGIFGGAADGQQAQFVNASKALRELPDILLRVRNQDPFAGESSNFEDRFTKEVLKFGPEVGRALVNGVRGLIGSEAKDERILGAISENVFNAANQIGESLNATFNVLKDLTPQLKKQKENISEAFNEVAEAFLEAASYQDEINSTTTEQKSFNKSVTKTKVKFGEITQEYFNSLKQSVGTDDPQALGRRASVSRNRIVQLQRGLSSEFNTPNQQETLSKELAAQKIEYERVRGALKNLSESTRLLGQAQDDLAEAEKKREFKGNILDTLTTGSNKDIQQLGKDIINATNISKFGASAFQGLVPEDKKSALDFIKSAAEARTKVGGKDADKVLEGVRLETAIKAGLSAQEAVKIVLPGQSDEAKAAQAAANELFSKQLSAIDELRKQSLTIGQIAAKDIAAQNQSFLTALFTIFKDESKRPLENQRKQLTGELSGLQGRAGALNTVGNNLGIAGAAVNIDDLTKSLDILKGTLEVSRKKADISGRFQNVEKEKQLDFTGLSNGEINKRLLQIGGSTGTDLTKFLEKTPEELFPTKQQQHYGNFLTGDESTTQVATTRQEQLAELTRQVRQELGASSNNQLNPLQNKLNKDSEDLRLLGKTGQAINGKTLGASPATLEKFLTTNSDLLTKIGTLPLAQTNKEIAELNARIAALTTEITTIDGKKPGFAKGGLVPGYGNRDSVNARLMPGEFVLTKDTVRDIGPENLEHFNKGGEVMTRRQRAVENLKKAKIARRAGYRDTMSKKEDSKARYERNEARKAFAAGKLREEVRAERIANRGAIQPLAQPDGKKPSQKPEPYRDFQAELDGLNAQRGFLNAQESTRRSSSAERQAKLTKEASEGYDRRSQEYVTISKKREAEEVANRYKKGSNIPALANFYKQEEDRKRRENELYLRKNTPVRRANGGIIGGSGNRDSVPALLTPGEFVMKKAAVNRIGANNLSSMNQGNRSAQGGGSMSLNVDQFRTVVQEFSVSTNKLATAMNAFTREITMTVNGKTEIVINGAEVLTRLNKEVGTIVAEKIKEGINNMLAEKFPTVGKM